MFILFRSEFADAPTTLESGQAPVPIVPRKKSVDPSVEVLEPSQDRVHPIPLIPFPTSPPSTRMQKNTKKRD